MNVHLFDVQQLSHTSSNNDVFFPSKASHIAFNFVLVINLLLLLLSLLLMLLSRWREMWSLVMSSNELTGQTNFHKVYPWTSRGNTCI